MSAMNDQNTDTAKRLKTLIQTKNTRATTGVSMPAKSSAQKIAMLATKKWYTSGMKRRRGSFATIAPKSGTAASMTTNVAVNIHCRFFTPPTMPISSRSGRNT